MVRSFSIVGYEPFSLANPGAANGDQKTAPGANHLGHVSINNYAF
jgi:hypothetical protein